MSSKPVTPLTDIHSVLKPVHQAKGLPNDHYISEAVYEEEKRSLLFNNWSSVAVGKNIPNAGDVIPIDFIGMPLLLVRDRDGSIGVFQNTCRHRGMILVDKPTKIKGVISCPYHGWCYGTKGNLRFTPHIGGMGINTHEDINNEELGLFKIRSHLWMDVIFVNISGDAPEFTDYASDLIERWKEFDQPIYPGGESSSYSIEVKTNWKLAVENFSESYHLPWVHPELNRYSKIQDHYNIDTAEVYGGQGTNVYQQLRGEGELTFPDFENLSDKWDAGAEYVTLFPNTILGIHRDHFYSMVLEPLGVGLTRENVELYYAQDIANDPAQSAQYQTMLDDNAERWRLVFSEDIGVVEGMQKSRYGEYFDGGKFSPVLDTATHCFHHWVAETLQKNRVAS